MHQRISQGSAICKMNQFRALGSGVDIRNAPHTGSKEFYISLQTFRHNEPECFCRRHMYQCPGVIEKGYQFCKRRRREMTREAFAFRALDSLEKPG